MNDVLSAKDVMKIGMRGYEEYKRVNWHGKILPVKYLLSRNDFLKLLVDIDRMCTTSSGERVGEFIDFAVRLNVVLSYAQAELPLDLDDAYKLMYHSDLFDVVIANVNAKQINAVFSYFGVSGCCTHE